MAEVLVEDKVEDGAGGFFELRGFEKRCEIWHHDVSGTLRQVGAFYTGASFDLATIAVEAIAERLGPLAKAETQALDRARLERTGSTTGWYDCVSLGVLGG